MDALKALNAPSGMTLGDLAKKEYITISERSPLFEIVGRMRAEGATTAIVVLKRKSTNSRKCRRGDHKGANSRSNRAKRGFL